MIHSFNLKPTVWHAKPLVFSWDDATGELSGRDAALIAEKASHGGISAHPLPWAHEFSAEPLKSTTDMAAIIGWEHEIPSVLAGFYPQPPEDESEEQPSADGIQAIGIEQTLY